MWWFLTTALASPWIPGSGDVRVSLTYHQLFTDRQLASSEAAGRTGPLCETDVQAGRPAPYDCTTGGRYRQHTAALDLAAGIGNHIATDVYLPVVLDAAFTDTLGVTRARGLGDLRAGLRYADQAGPFALAATLHIKAPTGPAGLVDRDVPLGDAQWDVIPGARVGTSLHPWGWVELHNHLAIRLPSQRSGIRPGHEWTGSLGGGFTPTPWIGVQLRSEWILALRDHDAFGLPHPGRKLLQLRSGLFLRHERLWTEVGVALPVAGQRWPAGPSIGASVAWTFGPSKR
ncbi:MAG: transporter [Proteobacteria bacterium]|nr:transporter [Pseudomonadota bacterium]